MNTSTETLYQKFLTSSGVTTDSRNCFPQAMFVALKGNSFNGNAFAAKALEEGCSCVVVDEPEYHRADDDRYILVENGLKALQQLANHHRRQLGTPLIGITGTNGKTTTKELIAAVLKKKYSVLYTEGNLNNAIGVPLTLLRLKPAHEIGVIEMGANHPGDIKELVEIAEPDFGLITNVGKAHLQGFKSFEGVVRTKGELYDYLRLRQGATIFIDADNPHLQEISQGLHKIAYGTNPDNDVCGQVTDSSPFLELEWGEKGHAASPHHIKTRLIGTYNLKNVLAAIAVGRHFGVEAADIDAALGEYTPKNSRSQLQQTEKNTLIIDAYNANPTSMKAAIDNFFRLKAENKMLILGQMGELGEDTAAEHQKVADCLMEYGFGNVMLVGEHFAQASHPYPVYPDTPSLIEALQQAQPTGNTILIKGSNSNKLVSVIPYL